MSVYKEGFYAVNAIERASKQIYPDACDYGAPTTKGDSLWKYAKQLFDWYGIKSTRQQENYETGKSVEAYVHLIDEWQTGDDIFYRVFYVTATRIPGGGDGIISVEKITDVNKIRELKRLSEEEMDDAA